jgi:hypothetical protein
VNEQDLPLSDGRPCHGKVQAISGIIVVGMTVYSWKAGCSKQLRTNIVKITEANYRDNPDLCMKVIAEALLSLPAGPYTVVYDTDPMPCVMDFRVYSKGCKLRVTSFAKESINRIKLPPVLRIVID